MSIPPPLAWWNEWVRYWYGSHAAWQALPGRAFRAFYDRSVGAPR